MTALSVRKPRKAYAVAKVAEGLHLPEPLARQPLGWGLGSAHLPVGVCRQAAADTGDGNQCPPAAPSPNRRAPQGSWPGRAGQESHSHPRGLRW